MTCDASADSEDDVSENEEPTTQIAAANRASRTNVWDSFYTGSREIMGEKAHNELANSENVRLDDERISHVLAMLLRYNMKKFRLPDQGQGFVALEDLLDIVREFKNNSAEDLRRAASESRSSRGPRFELQEVPFEDGGEGTRLEVRATYRHRHSKHNSFAVPSRFGFSAPPGDPNSEDDDVVDERTQVPWNTWNNRNDQASHLSTRDLSNERGCIAEPQTEENARACVDAVAKKLPCAWPAKRNLVPALIDAREKELMAERLAEERDSRNQLIGAHLASEKELPGTLIDAHLSSETELIAELQGESKTSSCQLPETSWQLFEQPDTGRIWFWNTATEEWFFKDEEETSGWRWYECNNSVWWLQESTGRFFFEPADAE